MANYSELHILKEEEQVLLKMSSMLTDQLKRLQVEELALLSEIRAIQSEDVEVDKAQKKRSEESTDINQQPLPDLTFDKETVQKQDTEEEFDSDAEELIAEQDPLKSFMWSLQPNTTHSS